MRCGRTFRLAKTHPAHARWSGSETLSRSRSLVGYTIDTHGSEFSEATGAFSRAYPYAAHARANASTCSLGKEPDVTSSRVCLPSSSLTNESSQYACGAFVKAILTVSCSRKSVTDN